MPLFFADICLQALTLGVGINQNTEAELARGHASLLLNPILGNLEKPIIQFCLYFMCKFVLVFYMFKSDKQEESDFCFYVFVELLLCDRHVRGTEDVAVNRTGKIIALMEFIIQRGKYMMKK